MMTLHVFNHFVYRVAVLDPQTFVSQKIVSIDSKLIKTDKEMLK